MGNGSRSAYESRASSGQVKHYKLENSENGSVFSSVADT